jgi:transposase InsO family protein
VSKERVIVLSVVQQQLSKAETARRYQVSWRWVHTLVTRYQTGGWEAVEARSRRPHNNSRAVATALRERICTLRCELQAAGLDHGPVSIAARLSHEGLRPPAFSTIRRILTSAGLISPEPKKRPKSSYRRFQADQPNECWQSDFTHWQLADSTGVEIINWLDDHSRYLLASRAYRRITGQGVITTGHILRSMAPPQPTPISPPSKPPQPLSAAIRTIRSVTTTSTASARPASAAPAACTTSASAPPTKAQR